MKIYAPVFTKDENQFVIASEHWVGKDDKEATRIGLGAFFECMTHRMEYTGSNIEIVDNKLPHIEMKLGDLPVFCFKGPLFEEHKAPAPEPQNAEEQL